MNLEQYLITITAYSSSFYLLVNPKDFDDFSCTQVTDIEGYICVASIEEICNRLSLSYLEALEEYLTNCGCSFVYREKQVKVSLNGTLNAWSNNLLDTEFNDFLDEKIDLYISQWKDFEIDLLINEWKEYIQQIDEEKMVQDFLNS